MNIKQLTEELDRILESDNIMIGEFELIPHGENAVKYYDKAVEYFKNHGNKVEKGYVNLPLTELGIPDDNTTTLGYELK